MVKIAVASEGNYVSQHFGHCEGFMIYDVESSVQKKNFVKNPGHRPGFLPDYLKGLGVDVVISGGMGEAAQRLFAQNNINVIVGAQGECDEVVELYLKNELKSTGSICTEHKYEGHCCE